MPTPVINYKQNEFGLKKIKQFSETDYESPYTLIAIKIDRLSITLSGSLIRSKVLTYPYLCRKIR